jgi:hypothetical protein
MKSSPKFAIVIVTLSIGLSTAAAGERHHEKSRRTQNQPSGSGQLLRKLGRQQLQTTFSNGNTASNAFVGDPQAMHHKLAHPKKYASQSNGMQFGDGRVAVNSAPATVTQPQGPAGYVFVNGHWQRATASGNNVVGLPPAGATVQIRDHRTVAPNGLRGGTPANYGPYRNTTPTDTNTSSGGVLVTATPPRPLNSDVVYGEGPGLHSIWNMIKGDFSAPNRGLGTPRDHRTGPSGKDNR